MKQNCITRVTGYTSGIFQAFINKEMNLFTSWWWLHEDWSKLRELLQSGICVFLEGLNNNNNDINNNNKAMVCYRCVCFKAWVYLTHSSTSNVVFGSTQVQTRSDQRRWGDVTGFHQVNMATPTSSDSLSSNCHLLLPTERPMNRQGARHPGNASANQRFFSCFHHVEIHCSPGRGPRRLFSGDTDRPNFVTVHNLLLYAAFEINICSQPPRISND